jgi:hypothetical protein
VIPEEASLGPLRAEMVHSMCNRNYELSLRRIEQDGVEVYEEGRRYVEAARTAGRRTAVVDGLAEFLCATP